jgi:hydrogenase-4 component B
MSEALILAAIALTAISGMPGAFMSQRSSLGERSAVVLMAAGSVSGLAGVLSFAVGLGSLGQSFPWPVPGGALAVRVDGISAMFLAQIFVISPLGSIYGLGYWPQAKHPDNGRKLRIFFGLLTAGMALLVVAQNSILFILGWETMALSAFLVLTTDDQNEAVQKSGFIYLVATRIGTLCLFAMFGLLFVATSTWTFAAPEQPLPLQLGPPIFFFALAGFGLKAGLMPLHVWLPGAHANAPSHVSAIMSGVLIKMGIYGLVRVSSFFEHPPTWWGVLLLGLGAGSGVLGVAFAIGQHDLKRLLAYHSVENIGIITMGLGLAVMGRSIGDAELVALGLGGALLHVWNHGLFKALLFLSAGSVLHATRTREIDQLGGLGKKMPHTALGFLVGAVAICGLPPLNGFVSELLVYLGLLRSTLLQTPRAWLAGAFGAPALALIGALAVACFVKVFGAVFLGEGRSEHARNVQESSRSMLAPMLVLGACCAFIGIAPLSVARVLDRATSAWAPELASGTSSVASLAPLGWLSVTACALIALIAAGSVLVARSTRPPRVASGVTWDCGYARPSPRMQYTSSSFAESLVGFFAWALRPSVHAARPTALFPPAERFESHVSDTVLERAVLPTSRAVGRLIGWFRWVQHGAVQLYLLYVLLAVVIALLLRR